MPVTVFFSWQGDTSNAGGRFETILKKIDEAAVFVPDLTFVGTRVGGRPTPNPNVLMEYGWALKSLKHARIVPVMNTAFGRPTADAMPFNMRHLRNPITYDCVDGLDEKTRAVVREGLAGVLERAIRTVLHSNEYISSLPKPFEPKRFAGREPANGPGRFRPRNDPIGIDQRGFYQGTAELRLSDGPVTWFRMMPEFDPRRTWSVADIEKAVKAKFLHPLSRSWRDYGFVQGSDGFGTYTALGPERGIAVATAYAFTTGELWAIDTFSLDYMKNEGRNFVPDVEQDYRDTLKEYGEFLNDLRVKPPYQWIAGMEDLKGRGLLVPSRSGYARLGQGPRGIGLIDVVEVRGTFSPGDSPAKTLKPFFARIYEACGVSRPQWQDE